MSFPAPAAGVDDGAASDGGQGRSAKSSIVLLLALPAGLGALWLIVHGFSMQFSLSPTTEAIESRTAGEQLVALGAGAFVLTGVGVWLSRVRRLRVVAAAFLVGAMSLVPAGEVWASRQTTPPAGDVDEVAAFVLPDSFIGGQIADNGRSGEIERFWRVDGPTADADTVCREVEAAMRAWAEPGSVVVHPTIRPCYLNGLRGGGRAILTVVPFEGDLSVKLYVDFAG